MDPEDPNEPRRPPSRAGPRPRSLPAPRGDQTSSSSRPALGKRTVVLGFVAATILLMGFVPIYNALTRPWPNDVYSVSADGMNIRVNGTLGSGDGGPFALRVASAVVRMRLATDDRHLVVELNSGGGSAGAAEMMAYSLLLANKLTRQGTATVVGRDSGCYSACTFLFAAGSRRNADPSAVFMFHQPSSGSIPWLPQVDPEYDSVKAADWLTGSTLSWVSFRSSALTDFLVDNGFYRFRDCYLPADQISRNFPGYFTGEATPIQTDVSPPLGSFLERPNFYDILIC
jgi:hypothetical protein